MSTETREEDLFLVRSEEACAWLLEPFSRLHAVVRLNGNGAATGGSSLFGVPSNGNVSCASVRDMMANCVLYGSTMNEFSSSRVRDMFRAINGECSSVGSSESSEHQAVDWSFAMLTAPVHITTDGIALALLSFDRGLNSNQLPPHFAAMFELDENAVSVVSARQVIDLRGSFKVGAGSFSALVELSNSCAIVCNYLVAADGGNDRAVFELFECVESCETGWKTLGRLVRTVKSVDQNSCGFCLLREQDACVCTRVPRNTASAIDSETSHTMITPAKLWPRYSQSFQQAYGARAISRQVVEVFDTAGKLIRGPVPQLKVSAFRSSSRAPSIRAESWLSAFAFQLSLLQDQPTLDARLVRSSLVAGNERRPQRLLTIGLRATEVKGLSANHRKTTIAMRREASDEITDFKRKRRRCRREFVCDQCGKSFGQGNHLSVHKRAVHDKERPFVCNMCGRGFGQRCNLLKHIRNVHTYPEITFRCEKCPKSYKTKSKLKEHRCSGARP